MPVLHNAFTLIWQSLPGCGKGQGMKAGTRLRLSRSFSIPFCKDHLHPDKKKRYNSSTYRIQESMVIP